jgi:hypothetical protein
MGFFVPCGTDCPLTLVYVLSSLFALLQLRRVDGRVCTCIIIVFASGRRTSGPVVYLACLSERQREPHESIQPTLSPSSALCLDRDTVAISSFDLESSDTI